MESKFTCSDCDLREECDSHPMRYKTCREFVLRHKVDSFEKMLQSACEEYKKACNKHPEFPNKGTTDIAIINEEYLEAADEFNKLTRAMMWLTTHWNDLDKTKYLQELDHVIVTAIRAKEKALGV